MTGGATSGPDALSLSYGSFIALAAFCVARVFGHELVRRGLGRWRDVTWIVWICLPAAIAGAKLGGILDAPARFLADPLAFLVDPEEHAFLGALTGGSIAFALVLRVRRLRVRPAFDALALALPVGYAIGRTGCFVHGCCRGQPSTLPWAWRYPGSELAVHPTQLYEALYAFGTYVLLWAMRDRPRLPGGLFLSYLALYCAGRFAVEWLRTNPRYAGLSQAQWLCAVGLGLCVGMWRGRGGGTLLALDRAPAADPKEAPARP